MSTQAFAGKAVRLPVERKEDAKIHDSISFEVEF
jgi:hypothetical protein